MRGTQGPQTVSTKLQRIAELASRHPTRAFNTLAHHIDYEWLCEAHALTRKDGAVGVDGKTAEDYAEHLEDNLRALLEGFKAGSYRAPPVRRTFIPKGGGKERALGIPTFEDKVLQRAVTMLLTALYEQDFRNGSFGFRPKRSAHQALTWVREGLRQMGGGWVIDMDIEAYFDSIDHGHLRQMLDQRVRDGVVRRMIDKWLKAGVLHEGVHSRNEQGTPQGGVISPLLGNIYLHNVLDAWFEDEVIPRLKGRAFVVRYADDAVLAFEHKSDAERVMEVLPKRLAKYGLRLHPEKTRLVDFTHPNSPPGRGGGGKPETFDLLGFTHVWTHSNKGQWIIGQKMAGDRLRRSLQKLDRWCKGNRHTPLPYQHEVLCRKLRGMDGYYGYGGNSKALYTIRHMLRRIWFKWLNRRNQKSHLNWEQMQQLLDQFPWPKPRHFYMPAPCIANL